jgi:hypothetical protein
VRAFIEQRRWFLKQNSNALFFPVCPNCAKQFPIKRDGLADGFASSWALSMAACGFGHCPFQLSVRVGCFHDARRFRALDLSPCGVFLQDGAVHVGDWRTAEWRLPGLDRDGAMPCLAALGLRRLPGLSWRPEHLKPPLPVQSWSVALCYDPADVAGLFRLFFDAHTTSM